MRGLSDEFMHDLQQGLLAPLRKRVIADQSLCLEIRQDYVNIYYRGGNLLRVERGNSGYVAFFDRKYAAAAEQPLLTLPSPSLREHSDVLAWLAAIPFVKLAMDLYLGRYLKEEREIQQLIVRDNNFGAVARSTDYYFCDIEYANGHGRFDMVAVHWPSTSSERKRQNGRRLALVEVKYGDGALDGPAGLHAHITSINAFLQEPRNLVSLKIEMSTVFNQKLALNLIDCQKNLIEFSDEPPLLLLVLANHDPDKSRLRKLLATLPPSPHIEIRLAMGSFLGYGLFDPTIVSLEEARTRYGACL